MPEAITPFVAVVTAMFGTFAVVLGFVSIWSRLPSGDRHA